MHSHSYTHHPSPSHHLCRIRCSRTWISTRSRWSSSRGASPPRRRRLSRRTSVAASSSCAAATTASSCSAPAAAKRIWPLPALVDGGLTLVVVPSVALALDLKNPRTKSLQARASCAATTSARRASAARPSSRPHCRPPPPPPPPPRRLRASGWRGRRGARGRGGARRTAPDAQRSPKGGASTSAASAATALAGRAGARGGAREAEWAAAEATRGNFCAAGLFRTLGPTLHNRSDGEKNCPRKKIPAVVAGWSLAGARRLALGARAPPAARDGARNGRRNDFFLVWIFST